MGETALTFAPHRGERVDLSESKGRVRGTTSSTEWERLTQDDPFEGRAIEAVRSGNAGSYDYLVSKYSKRVVSIAWGIVRNAHDAEDLAQEAFVKAFQNIGRFKTGQPFGP